MMDKLTGQREHLFSEKNQLGHCPFAQEKDSQIVNRQGNWSLDHQCKWNPCSSVYKQSRTEQSNEATRVAEQWG
jgi:hypothetical protein